MKLRINIQKCYLFPTKKKKIEVNGNCKHLTNKCKTQSSIGYDFEMVNNKIHKTQVHSHKYIYIYFFQHFLIDLLNQK